MCCPIFLIMGVTLAERKFAIRAAATCATCCSTQRDPFMSMWSTERQFAEALEMNDGAVLYAKLPSWFKVRTPPGP